MTNDEILKTIEQDQRIYTWFFNIMTREQKIYNLLLLLIALIFFISAILGWQ